ncbi:MAG: protoporphyrinogen/coproporphyrinogen oxidase [Candidatus Geothermincolia bacterium]
MGQGEARRAVVIGGGLAGLSAAVRLVDSGWRVKVLEEKAEAGGKCRSIREGGFTFDTGAQHFHDSFDDTLAVAIRNGLGGDFRIPLEPKGIFHGGRLSGFTPRDLNPVALLPWEAMGPAGLLDSISVGARLLRGYRGYNVRFPVWWSGGDDRTAYNFLSRRTTPGYMRRIAEPVSLYAGAAGPEELSAAGYMVALRYTFFDRTGGFTGGMGSLPEALAAKVDVITGMRATRVVRDGKRATGVGAEPAAGGRSRTFKADCVICALPAPHAGNVAGKVGSTAQRVIRETTYAPAIVVNLAFARQCRPGGPLLLPSREGFSAAWICSGASKAAEHAPDGSSVVTAVFCGDDTLRLIDEPDEVLQDLALADSERVYGTRRAEHKSGRVDRHHMARPVVSPGYSARVKALRRDGSGIENLVFAGGWTASPTVEGAISSGMWAAGSAIAKNGAPQ